VVRREPAPPGRGIRDDELLEFDGDGLQDASDPAGRDVARGVGSDATLMYAYDLAPGQFGHHLATVSPPATDDGG
jgi:hypothetical protein